MRFTDALYYALMIKKRHPDYILCGSVALILAGKMDVQDVGDIDFVVHKSKVNETNIQKHCEESCYPQITDNKNEGYRSYKIENHDSEKGMYDYNLLVFDSMDDITKREVKFSIDIQVPDQIIAWKKKYNRPKDKKHIKQMEQKARKKRRGNRS